MIRKKRSDFLFFYFFVLLLVGILLSFQAAGAGLSFSINNSKVSILAEYNQSEVYIVSANITSAANASNVLYSYNFGEGKNQMLANTDRTKNKSSFWFYDPITSNPPHFILENNSYLFSIFATASSGIEQTSAAFKVVLTVVCGNNRIDENEMCDPDAGRPVLLEGCSDVRHDFIRGVLGCTRTCEYNVSGCISNNKTCGNGAIDGFDSCDFLAGEPVLGSATCKSLGFVSGTLGCRNDCEFDTDACASAPSNSTRVCGNKILDEGELCDGIVKNESCKSVGNFLGGTLSCTLLCGFDKSKCIENKSVPVCGDGKISGNELCDYPNIFDSKKRLCTDFPQFINGTLKCNRNCTLDVSACVFGNNTNYNKAGTCKNTLLDPDESDIDCGGFLCAGCADGKKCKVNTDCSSNYCKSGICTKPTCTDGVLNGFESDLDCGSSADPDCPACGAGSKCKDDFNCDSKFCNPSTSLCAEPSCSDGFANGGEPDVDCGSVCSSKCGDKKKCFENIDCKSGYCDGGFCSFPDDLDTDGDGMPDKWENRYGFDLDDPSDADEDADKDGYTNLEEYLNGTDPTNSDDPPKSGPGALPITLLSLGLLSMVGSTGFLIYSRKVLVSASKAAISQPFGQLKQTPNLGTGAGQRTMQGSAASPSGGTHAQIGAQQGSATRFVSQPRQPPTTLSSPQGTRHSARKSLLSGFDKSSSSGVAQQQSSSSSSSNGKASLGKTIVGKEPDSEEFISLSDLGKKASPAKGQASLEQPAQAQRSGSFDKLKNLIGKEGEGGLKQAAKKPSKK